MLLTSQASKNLKSVEEYLLESVSFDPEMDFYYAEADIATYRGSRDDSFGWHSQASFNTGNADSV